MTLRGPLAASLVSHYRRAGVRQRRAAANAPSGLRGRPGQPSAVATVDRATPALGAGVQRHDQFVHDAETQNTPSPPAIASATMATKAAASMRVTESVATLSIGTVKRASSRGS